MDKSNVVSGEITPEKLAELVGRIAAIRAELPFLVSLTEEQMRSLTKPGDEALEACAGIAGVAERYPAHFSQAIIDPAELRRDLALARNLARFAEVTAGLARAVEHTILAARSDVYRNGLKGYTVGQVVQDQIPGLADEIAPLREVLDRPARPRATGDGE